MGKRTIFAVLLILLGIVLILNQTTAININFSEWWPLIIVLIGVMLTINRSISFVSGVFVVLLGAAIQLRKLDILITDKLLFPVLLILAGLWVIFSSLTGKKKAVNRDHLDDFVILSGFDTRINSANFTGGNVTAVFGGADIDLRDANLSPAGGRLDLTAVFGGIEVRVPEDWNVVVTGTPIFGGWESKLHRRRDSDEGPVLKIHCTAVFGGVDIKH